MRHRRPWRRIARRVALLVALLALTATLAAALHVREIDVTGCRRFPTREVEEVLRTALGTPTVAARPDELRAAVRAVRWVDDAQVRVSLDGVVSCSVEERVPVAVADDLGERTLVDAGGRILGPATGPQPAFVLSGFAPHPEERAALLRVVPALEAAWGTHLESARRVGPSDVALSFAETPFPVLADPRRPEAVATARSVLTAWVNSKGAAPLRLDVRMTDRVVVLPAPTPQAEEQS